MNVYWLIGGGFVVSFYELCALAIWVSDNSFLTFVSVLGACAAALVEDLKRVQSSGN